MKGASQSSTLSVLSHPIPALYLTTGRRMIRHIFITRLLKDATMQRHVTFADDIGNNHQRRENAFSEEKYPAAATSKVVERPGTAYPIGKLKPATKQKPTDQEKMQAAVDAYIQKRLSFLNDPAAQDRHMKKQAVKNAKAEKKEKQRIKNLRPGY
jgi:hypothetical protein